MDTPTHENEEPEDKPTPEQMRKRWAEWDKKMKLLKTIHVELKDKITKVWS